MPSQRTVDALGHREVAARTAFRFPFVPVALLLAWQLHPLEGAPDICHPAVQVDILRPQPNGLAFSKSQRERDQEECAQSVVFCNFEEPIRFICIEGRRSFCV